MQAEETIQITTMAEPVHITVTRNAKGRYQYEISVHTKTADEAFDIGVELDARLKKHFEGQLAGEEAKAE